MNDTACAYRARMVRASRTHLCGACGHQQPRWAGRCPSCGRWNTLEPVDPVAAAVEDLSNPPEPVSLASVERPRAEAEPTGFGELDRVLAGGLVPGSVTLVGGEPGIGKSTLLLQVLMARAGGGERVLLASAEESAHQVRRRADRLGSVSPELLVLPGTGISAVETAVAVLQPSLVVVDSIQAAFPDGPDSGEPGRSGAAGSVARVRACAERLVTMAKQADVATVLIGHVTKDGSLAGPRSLEHLVDTVLSFEGDRHHALRILRSVKHRFGPTGELGLLEMGPSGLASVDDPARFLLGDRRPGAAGGTVVAVQEGKRTLVAELQALLVPTSSQQPRRTSVGLDPGRLAMVLAVLQRHTDLPVRHMDVFASVVGGIRAAEPAADLAVALAVASAMSGVPVPPDLVAIGEVGLTGEVRQVPDLQRRLDESARCGFTRAVVPRSAPRGPDGMRLLRVESVGQALAHLDLISLARPPASGQARPGTLLA